MKSKALQLGLCAATVVFSGCATHKTRSGRDTTLLGGVAQVSTGSYQLAKPTTFVPIETDKLIGRGNPSGTKVSLLWGLVTFTDS